MICLFPALSKAGVFPSSFKRLLNYELQCILFGLSLGVHSLGSNGPFYNSLFLCVGIPKGYSLVRRLERVLKLRVLIL